MGRITIISSRSPSRRGAPTAPHLAERTRVVFRIPTTSSIDTQPDQWRHFITPLMAPTHCERQEFVDLECSQCACFSGVAPFVRQSLFPYNPHTWGSPSNEGTAFQAERGTMRPRARGLTDVRRVKQAIPAWAVCAFKRNDLRPDAGA
jgi:hypothetical protein